MKLKYLFKVHREHIIRDLFQILVIIVLFVFVILELLFCDLIFSMGSTGGCGALEPKPAVKKALSYINQAITIEKELKGSVNYNDINSFATILVTRMPRAIDVRYLKVAPYKVKNWKHPKDTHPDTYTTIEYPYKEYSKKEIKDFNLSEYQGKPIIQTPDGILYMLYKFENGCKTVDLDTPKNSSCLVDVDINGIKKHNRKDFNIKNPSKTDRYTFIINGNNDTIIPAKMYHDMIFEKKENENG